jgi:hypothetical protein
VTATGLTEYSFLRIRVVRQPRFCVSLGMGGCSGARDGIALLSGGVGYNQATSGNTRANRVSCLTR